MFEANEGKMYALLASEPEAIFRVRTTIQSELIHYADDYLDETFHQDMITYSFL